MKQLLILFIFIVNATYAAAEDAKKLEKVSVQLHWKYQFEFAGFIAAKEKGFYKDAGLDVELKEYKYGINIVDEVLKKRANYAVYNSNILIDYLQNRPILLLSSYFKRSALVLVTKPYIKSPQDLIGKTIMASGKEDFDLNFKPLFDVYNIDTASLKFTNHTYKIDDFIHDKNIDALTAFISDQPHQLSKLGFKYNIINPSDYGTFNLQLELFTSKDEALNYNARTKKFRDTTIEGWDYALSHQEEIIDIIHKKYAPSLTKDTLRHEAKEIERLILPYTYSIGSIDKNFLNRQIEVFKANYHIDSDKTVDDFLFVDNEKNRLKLTKDEKSYLKSHNKLNLCLQYNQFPYDGYKDNRYTGIMSDIYQIISRDLGITFTVIPSSSNEVLQKRLKNKECEILSILPTRSTDFPDIVATKPFVKSHFTLVSRLDKSFTQDLDVLKHKKLIVQFPIYKEYLLSLYPFLEIEVEEDINKMVKKVLKNEVYAAVEIDEKADYLVDKYGYGKLKINGFLAKEKPISGSIGVNKEDPLLYSIIQKEIDNISPQKIENIINSWRLTRYRERTDYTLVFKILVAVGIVISIMVYYQRRLKRFNIELEKKVRQKTRELQEINEFLENSVKEKAEELIQKDKILTVQSKQAVMGEMISMIAHQWRQPLSTITLLVSNLQIKKMMGEITDEKEYDKTLNKISETIIYLSETIDDFQTFFSPDRKSTEIEIHELLQKAVNFTIGRAKDKNIEISIKKERDIHAKVYVNELIQVILNILNNAIDAFEGVKREKKQILLHVRSRDGMIEICIEDNGSGISEDIMDKLFEPYFSTKGKNGTGLGLYMSKMIIEKQFSGQIDVKTSTNGSVFIVKIAKN